MRLRYLHLQNYPPITNLTLSFASGSPLQAELQRQCAIHFVVGVNGSGKSNLLRAVAEVFLAVADERLPPFPVSLVYELGLRNTTGFSTFVIDCPGSKAEASVWVAERWNWPDGANRDEFEAAIAQIRAGNSPDKFRTLISRGDWPQSAGIAMPKAVLAYTTGELSPWRSIWSRNQNGERFTTDADEEAYHTSDERPAGWSMAQEAGLPPAQKGKPERYLQQSGQPSTQGALYRRPILLDPVSLKCALSGRSSASCTGRGGTFEKFSRTRRGEVQFSGERR